MKYLLVSALLSGLVALLGCGRNRDSGKGEAVQRSASTTTSQELPIKSATTPSTSRTVDTQRSANSLPESLASVLPEIKSKSRVPVLLPSDLPKPIADATHALVEKAEEDTYAISLYYELGVGDSGLAAFFTADAHPSFNPADEGNPVNLFGDIRGYFSPVSCGGSCAPANLWWEDKGVLYQIQVKLPSNLDEEDQKKTITAIANSSIVAGPR